MRPITERYANVSFGGKTLDRLLFYSSGRGLAQIPWKCLQTGRRCGEFLVSANPLIFNGICFNIAFPIGNNFISLFLTGSLILLQAYTFNWIAFQVFSLWRNWWS